MDDISLKKATISSYCSMPSTEIFADNSIIVVTAYGIITGKPLSDNESDIKAKAMKGLNDGILNAYRKKIDIADDKPIPGNDGFFTLKDASIISGSITSNIDLINIFYDQVIAVTLGNIG
ncbi:hypothetical protein [Clostridium sp. YIM B02569]|uniref:hypothetical protein n=1 Tax=Clostridium sp. YIM B02569 TaxID=2911967 RepID=UPI001EEAFEB8|nr:hypothetical protein [Clostridium sp. YIM B02569]